MRFRPTAYLRSRPIPCWPGQTTLTPGDHAHPPRRALPPWRVTLLTTAHFCLTLRNCQTAHFYGGQLSPDRVPVDADHPRPVGLRMRVILYLMFDIEAIDTQKEYQLSSEARADFITLFNAVPSGGGGEPEEHLCPH